MSVSILRLAVGLPENRMASGQAEDARRSRVMFYCCSRFGVRAAVSVMTAFPSRMAMGWPVRSGVGGEAAGTAVFVDSGFVLSGPESQNVESGSESRC